MPSFIAKLREAATKVRRRRLKFAGPRAFQVFCLGTIRSGTTTLAKIFDHYRSEHETDCDQLVPMTIAAYRGDLDEAAARRVLKHRDQKNRLEMESAHFLAYLSPLLSDLFPTAKFILTIRDPMEWLNSAINHHHRHPFNSVKPIWVDFRETAFGRFGREFSPEEIVLKENGLYPIQAYLKYWLAHNTRVLADIPESRLLVLRTHEISSSLTRIARFVGCAPETLSEKWSNAGEQDYGLLRRVPREFVLGEIERHCASLAREYFASENGTYNVGGSK